MSTSNAPIETHTAQDGKGILITHPAMEQLSKLCGEQGKGEVLRVGVRSGGCSGMSYTMDFIASSEIQKGDEVYEYTPRYLESRLADADSTVTPICQKSGSIRRASAFYSGRFFAMYIQVFLRG